MSSNSAAKIYVGRLSSKTRERDLEDTFGRFGKILRTDLKYGFAFVEFEDVRDAEDAVKDMDGRTVDGSRIMVQMAKGGRDRDGDRGDRGRRDGGRDRDYDRRDRDRDSRDSRDRRDSRDGRDRDSRDSRDGRERVNKCFNCGKEGHWARECPDENGRDRCFNCGHTGHLARECKEKRGSNGNGGSDGSSSNRHHPYSRPSSSRKSPSGSRSRSPKRDSPSPVRRSPRESRKSGSPNERRSRSP